MRKPSHKHDDTKLRVHICANASKKRNQLEEDYLCTLFICVKILLFFLIFPPNSVRFEAKWQNTNNKKNETIAKVLAIEYRQWTMWMGFIFLLVCSLPAVESYRSSCFGSLLNVSHHIHTNCYCRCINCSLYAADTQKGSVFNIQTSTNICEKC